MKLVLDNNQSERFKAFHASLQGDKEPVYEYAGYKSLLFSFEVSDGKGQLSFSNVDTGSKHTDFDGVYINGYLFVPEYAVTVAKVLDIAGIHYVNSELADGYSLSKLSAYAKLAGDGVAIPKTLAGSAYALKKGLKSSALTFPLVLKRADADRGIDNFMVSSAADVTQILDEQLDKSIWLLQEFIPNDGFYVVSFQHGNPQFAIYRELQERPDKNAKKAHFFKPKGGKNAELIPVKELPKEVIAVSQAAILAMKREIASVDIVLNKKSGEAVVLEVNYNPQLVTIETFKDIRQKSFLESMKMDWSSENTSGEKVIIGSVELIDLPQLKLQNVPARIDTGAESCALWASEVKLVKGKLQTVFFDKSSPYYSGQTFTFDNFKKVDVTSSNGARQKRFKISLKVRIKDQDINCDFTLADRSTQTYPVLIGRNFLSGRFLVDVSKGEQS